MKLMILVEYILIMMNVIISQFYSDKLNLDVFLCAILPVEIYLKLVKIEYSFSVGGFYSQFNVPNI